MVEWYESLASKHPSLVTLVPSIGKTHYSRNIMALHFSDKKSGGVHTEKKPVIYIQCLLHSREFDFYVAIASNDRDSIDYHILDFLGDL